MSRRRCRASTRSPPPSPPERRRSRAQGPRRPVVDPHLPGVRVGVDRARSALGRDYIAAAPVPDNASAGLTGSSAIREDQFDTINDWLPIVVGVTLALIVLVVAVVFRSLVAPFVVLGTVAVAYVDIHAIGAVAEATGIAASQDIEPVVSALLIGIVTDYAIFYLFGVRSRLARGDARQAAVGASAHMVAIVVTAGLITALGTATLLVGDVDFFRAFAPASPSRRSSAWWCRSPCCPRCSRSSAEGLLAPPPAARRRGGRRPAAEGAARRPPPDEASRGGAHGRRLGWRAGGGGLAAAGPRAGTRPDGRRRVELEGRRGGLRRGRHGAHRGPRRGPGAADAAVLARLRDRLRERPGVADVVGPSDPVRAWRPRSSSRPRPAPRASSWCSTLSPPGTRPSSGSMRSSGRCRHAGGLGRARGAGVARRRHGDRERLGRRHAHGAAAGGDRRAGRELPAARPVPARARRASYLLAANALTVAATLGITTWLFQDVLDQGQLVYYVPFATSVLLLALGSDYTIYLVGASGAPARRVGIVQGVREAMPAASRGISVARLVLAGSFGVLALVPMDAMRQLAFVMALGVALDAFVVRPCWSRR